MKKFRIQLHDDKEWRFDTKKEQNEFFNFLVGKGWDKKDIKKFTKVLTK
jgi:hypothetical protein